MSSRSIQLQVVLLIVVLSFGASIGWIPGDIAYPPDDITATVSGHITDHNGTPVDHGRVVAIPSTYNSYRSGQIGTEVQPNGTFNLTLTRDQSYTLAFYEYNNSDPPGQNTTLLLNNGIPDVYTIGTVTANQNKQISPTELPKAHRIQIRVRWQAADTKPMSNGTVSIYHIRGENTGVGFVNQTIGQDGYVRVTESNRRTIELAGRLLLAVNASSFSMPREHYYNITDDGQVNVTVNKS